MAYKDRSRLLGDYLKKQTAARDTEAKPEVKKDLLSDYLVRRNEGEVFSDKNTAQLGGVSIQSRLTNPSVNRVNDYQRFLSAEREEADRRAARQAKMQTAIADPNVIDTAGEAKKATLGDDVRYIQERGRNAFAAFNENLNTLGEGVYQGINAFRDEFAKPGNDSQLDDAFAAFWSGYKSAMDAAAEENYSAKLESETEEKFKNSAANPVVKTVADTVSSFNTMLPSMAVSAAAGPVGAGVMLGAQTMPGAYIEARNNGASQDQALAYSALEGVNAGVGEFLIGGLLGKGTGLIGKGANAITKGAVGRFVGNLSNSLAKSPLGKTLISAGAKSLGEGAEEIAQGMISTLNERLTYNPDAKLDAKGLLYEGLLGSLMGGTFQTLNLPSQYQAYRSDYDTVNGFSLAANAVRSTEDVDLLKKIGGSIIEQADNVLSDKKADNDAIQRTSYVKQGVQKTLDLLENNSEKIIGGNAKKADALETVISSDPDSAVDNLISFVDSVSDGADANDSVNKAVDFVKGEIQNARNLLAETENSSVRTRLTENLINYQEVESTLRNKRKEIVSLIDKKKAAPVENVPDTNVGNKSEAVESVSENAVESVAPGAEVSADVKSEAAEAPEAIPAKEETEPVRGAADYNDLSTALGVELTGNAEEDARMLLDSYRGARRAAKAVLASATAEGVSDNVRAYGKTLDSEIRRLNRPHTQKTANAMRIALKKYGVENVVVDENAGDIGVNGYYDRETNTIHISPYVSEDGAVGRVILHEFTHRGAQADSSLVDAILEAREKLVASGWFEKNHKDLYSREVYEKAYADKVAGKSEAEAKAEIDEEIAAHFMEQIMEDENILDALAREDRTVLQRILDMIRDFFDKGGKENRMAERAVQKIEAVLNKSAAAKSEGVKIHAEGGIITNKNGDAVASDNGNGNLRLSLETYQNGGRDVLIDYLENESDVDMADRVDIVKTLDEVFKICESMTDEYAPFGEWSYAKVDMDENGNPVLSVIKPNGEYVMNLDFSLVCKKRRTLDAVFNEMIRRGVISDFELGQDRIVKINDIIRDHGFEVACAICFVDAKRFRQAKVADDFVKMYNSLVKSMAKNGEEIAYFNFGGDTTLPAIEGGIDTRSNSEVDTSRLEKIIANAKNKTVQVKIAQHLLDHPADRKLLSRGDFMSSEGFEAVKRLNPDVLSLYNSKKGSGGPKAAFGDVQYMSDVIKSSKFNAEKAYSVGGVRVQSFSDYVARLVFDYVQMIGDMAAKGLPAHAYTKEALFVKQFGLTGMKINMSLVPAVGDGKYAGLNADGSYAWSNETFDYDTAMEIQSDPEYAKNCGTIAVGISDEHIRKLLADDNIRMVIPYHKSGLNPVVAKMNKIDRFSDYTKSQNTRYANGTKLSKEDAAKAPNFNELLHGGMDAVEASKVYVKWCEDNGYLPKFDQFAYNEDGTVSENYYKLLEDFTTMVDGEYHPQGAVKAVFPGEDAAFGSMESLIREGLEEDAVTQGKRDAAVGDIVDEVVALFEGEDTAAKEKSTDNRRESRELEADGSTTIDMSDSERTKFEYTETQKNTEPTGDSVTGKTTGKRLSISSASDNSIAENAEDVNREFDVRYSRELDREYLTAVESGDMEAAQRMVDEAAKKAGYKTNVYHGTNASRFYIFDFSKDERNNNQMFFSSNRKISETYGSNVMSLKINTKNFLVVDADGEWWSGFDDKISKEKAEKLYYDNLKRLSDKYYDLDAKQFSLPYGSEEYKDNFKATQKAYQEYETLKQRGGVWGDEYISGTTYTVANYAKDNGYDGVIIKNVIDVGDKIDIDEVRKNEKKYSSTVYAVFSPDKVKSADPVTYDDNGNVIPLSQRFKSDNDDIRYSRELDGEYMSAVERGDAETAQAMVDEAARAHGYPIKAYHGTPTGGFTKFDPSRIGSNTGVGRGRFSFTSDKSVADSYSGKNNKNARASELVTALNSLFRKHDSDELRMLLVDDTEIPVVWDSDIVIAEGAYDHDYIQFDEDWEDNTPELYANAQEARTAKAAAEFEGTRRYLIDTLKDYRKGADSSLDEFFDEAIAMLESKSPDRKPETYSVYLKTPTAEFEADPKTYNSVAWDAAYSGDDVVVIHLDNGEDRYFVNNPSSIKSADAIVYDDDGNVVPLSERFKDSNDDIRYSRELETEEETRDRKLDSLREYVEKRLDKKTADEWEKSASMTARKKFADDIVNEMPGVTKDTVTEALRDVWGTAEKVKSSKGATAEGVLDELRGKARQAAEKLVDESVVTLVDPRYEEYKELFANLRGTPISVESARSGFDTEEAFEEWKKSLAETLDISEDGVDVIKVYNEWAEQYPEFLENTPDFSDAIKAGDRLLSLAKHTKALSEKWKMNPYETVREQAVDTLEMRILAGFAENAEPTQSAKDKATINLLSGAAKLLEKDVKMLQREVKTLNRQIAILEKRIIGHSESLTLASEQRKYKKNLGRILTALNTPSRKKHIPDNIKGMVVEVLAELDNPKLSAAKRIDSERLNDILTAIKAKDPETITLKNVSGADEDASDVKIDDEVIKRLGQNVEQLNALKLSVESFDRARNSYEGTASEYNAEMRRKVIMLYQQANEVVKALSGYINQSNQVFIDGKIVETQEFVSEMISDLNAKKDVSGDDKMGFTAEVLRGVRAYARSLMYESVNPQQFFEMMGASGVRLANSFRTAQNKQQARNLRFVEFMTDLIGKNYDIYEVSGKKPGSRIEITIGESTIDVSRAQLMSLYCLWNRDAGRSHLEAQGAIFLTRRGEEKIERTFAINEEIFDSLMSHLTEKDIEVAKEIQNYLSTECAHYGNEASLQMYGYSMFGETHYFPIRVSSSVKLAHAKEWGAAAGQMNLEFSSFTNSVQPNSTSAIVIDDIFDVSENHAARMSAFSAYAPICHDLQYALKDGRLREAIVRAMGKEGERYLVDFLAAVNGNDSISKKSKEHPRSFAFFEVVGNLSKRAYVSANLSTVTKQYTSITRACAEIDTSYLIKAKRGISSKELYNEMTAHSGVAQIKALGYSDTAFGKSLREQWDNGFVRGGSIINSTEATRTIKRNYDKINDIAMRGTAKADERTWTVLWGACRAEILDKNPGIAYDELMSKTAERFNRLIGVTQVVDSVMDTALFTRRVKGTGFGAFMNEGIRSYGQLLVAVDGVKNGRPGAKKKLAKTVSGILASTVILEPLISALFATLRDENDDTDQFFGKVLKNLIGVDLTDDRAIDESIATLESVLTSEVFDGFMNLVPAIGQIYNLINDAWQGYSSSRIGVDELEKVVNTAKALNKASDSSMKTKTKATLEFIGAVSTVVGLPVDRVIRGTTAAVRNAIALTDNHWMQWELNKVFYNLSNGNALSQKNFYDIMKHTKNEGDAESYRKMFADLNTVIRETPSVVGVSNALEKLAKKGAVASEVGSEMWNIEVQSRFYLDDFVSGYKVENFLATVYNNAKRNGADYMKVYLDMPSSDGKFNIEHKPDGKYSYTKETKTEVVKGVPVQKITYRIDEAGYEQCIHDIGLLSYQVLAELRSPSKSSAWNSLNAKQQIRAIELVYDYAKSKAKTDYDSSYDINGQGKWMTPLYANNAGRAAIASAVLEQAKSYEG